MIETLIGIFMVILITLGILGVIGWMLYLMLEIIIQDIYGIVKILMKPVLKIFSFLAEIKARKESEKNGISLYDMFKDMEETYIHD